MKLSASTSRLNREMQSRKCLEGVSLEVGILSLGFDSRLAPVQIIG